VLGALTILKEDYFPGMKSSRLPQLLPGACVYGTLCPFFVAAWQGLVVSLKLRMLCTLYPV
jgi:hypothetical protein